MTAATVERIRIAYFVPPSLHFAGIERVVHEIASGLMDAHGDVLDVHVLFSSAYDDAVLENTNYTLHVLGVERLRGLAAALRRCVSEQDFDVLICPQVEASVIGWLATRGLRLPIFITHLHGNPRLEEREGTRRTRMAFSLFRHIVSRRIACVLAVSPSLRQYAAESVSRRAPVHYAPNPVRALGSPQRTASAGRFEFLSVGRLSRQKGQDILLRALAIARPDLPPVTLTLVGTGSDEAMLKQLSSDLELSDMVEFAGYTPDPAAYFRAADCFVLSSRWEGFGVVLVEALQFGLPLLAADCEFGPADVISDPTIGDLVSPDDPEALAVGLTKAVLRNRDSAEDEDLRRRVASTYSRAEATKMHARILMTMVAGDTRLSGRMPSLVLD